MIFHNYHFILKAYLGNRNVYAVFLLGFVIWRAGRAEGEGSGHELNSACLTNVFFMMSGQCHQFNHWVNGNILEAK